MRTELPLSPAKLGETKRLGYVRPNFCMMLFAFGAAYFSVALSSAKNKKSEPRGVLFYGPLRPFMRGLFRLFQNRAKQQPADEAHQRAGQRIGEQNLPKAQPAIQQRKDKKPGGHIHNAADSANEPGRPCWLFRGQIGPAPWISTEKQTAAPSQW